MKKMNKKGAMGLGELPGVALSFLLIGLFFSLTLVVLAALGSTTAVSGNADAQTAVNNTIDAVSEIPNNWLTIIAIIVAISIVIGIVVLSFRGVGNVGGR